MPCTIATGREFATPAPAPDQDSDNYASSLTKYIHIYLYMCIHKKTILPQIRSVEPVKKHQPSTRISDDQQEEQMPKIRHGQLHHGFSEFCLIRDDRKWIREMILLKIS